MRTFILCCIFGMLSLTTYGQEIDLGKIKIGAFVGTNISTYSMQSEQLETSSRFGYQVGAYFRYGGRLYLHSGLTWYRVAVNIEELDPAFPRQGRVGINIIQLPILAGLNILEQEQKARTFRILAGPAVSVLTGVNENDLQLSGDDFTNLWWSARLGLGVDLWILTLDTAYQWGLNNAFSGNGVDGAHRMATLSIGIRL